MGKVHILILFVFNSWLVSSVDWAQGNPEIRCHAVLQLNDRRAIPFEVTYTAGKQPGLSIYNGEERIDLRRHELKNLLRIAVRTTDLER